MEAFIMTVATIGGGAGLVYIANRLGEAQARLELLRSQRRRDRR